MILAEIAKNRQRSRYFIGLEGGDTMTISRDGVRGILIGAGLMTGFGALWALGSAGAFAGSASVLLLVVVLVVAASLIVAMVRLWQQAGTLPAQRSPEEAVYWQKTGKWFGIVFISEALAIVVASRLLRSTTHDTLIPPVIALIVGVHFLPLASLFRVPVYYVTGALMSLFASVCIVAVALGLHLGGASLFVWSSVVGIGSAIILWGTAIGIVAQGQKLLRQAIGRSQ
jgi:hypothetical protein